MCKKGPLKVAWIIFEAAGTQGPKSEILQKGTIKGGAMVRGDDIE